MPITVNSRQDGFVVFQDGHDWFIDEVGRLFIRDTQKKHIAAFHETSWGAVSMSEPRPTKADMERHITARAESKARIAEAKAKTKAKAES